METLRMLWQEIRDLTTDRKALRSFGWVVGGVLVAIAVLIWWRHDRTATTAVYWLGGIGGALSVLGLTAPAVLKPIYRVWMALAVVLGFVMTRVLLTLVFYLVLTPIGLLLHLFGRDPLHRSLDSESASYWIPKTYADESKKRLEKYY